MPTLVLVAYSDQFEVCNEMLIDWLNSALPTNPTAQALVCTWDNKSPTQCVGHDVAGTVPRKAIWT